LKPQKQKLQKNKKTGCRLGDLAPKQTREKTMPQEHQTNHHQPVLLAQVISSLQPQKGQSYLDVTAGYGGHALAIAERTDQVDAMTLVDRDKQAIAALQPLAKRGAHLIQSDFLTASQQLVGEQKQFDMILADLGLSSPHLDNASRGFSFLHEAPLDMRMDTDQTLTAAAVVNSYSEADLADILWRFGQEPKARQIARMIVKSRPFKSTTQLAQVVARAWPGYSKVHPATRSFQAIRIVVNDELGQLQKALPLWVDLLKPGGRLAVISFHSLEDRIVKQLFAEYALGYEARLELPSKKPQTASQDEIVSNPRARSAKLRVAVKK
jgi:16S rRNA (cytosine1402-N4)-methyltransferase